MNNYSQSPNIFSPRNTDDTSCESAMDVVSYESLVRKLKISLHEQKELISTERFTLILQDCETGIIQCLELIENTLNAKEVEAIVLCSYLQDAVDILLMLSDFIKKILECMELTCSNTKLFPTTTANIILNVFKHCKVSENMYGVHINKIQEKLKDLFRTCHELQLTYLTTLEKHFMFDFFVAEELDVLLECLDINVRIGEVVQVLDVKTMAAQWKAYTSICEKYSMHLMNRNIYNKCSLLFADLVKSNIKIAIETEEDKLVLRSIKVAGFGIMILLKLTNTFRNDSKNNYDGVVNLLVNVLIYNSSYVKFSFGKSTEFLNLIEKNLSNACDNLIEQLIMDHNFMKCVTQQCTQVNNTEEEIFFGKLMLLMSVANRIIRAKEQEWGDIRVNLLRTLFIIIPDGHVWFNLGIVFKNSNNKFAECGLFEHLLINAVAFVSTFSADEFSQVERMLYEAVLSSDCYTALFAGNLWILLMRLCNKSILTNTLQCLIRSYQKLSTHGQFQFSPQKIHMTYLLRGLFEYLAAQHRLLICKQYNVLDENNFDIWIALKVSNLPSHVVSNVKQQVLERLSRIMNNLSLGNTEHNNTLVQLIKLAATCTYTECDQINEVLQRGWLRACPTCAGVGVGPELSVETICLYTYVEALTELVRSVEDKINKKTALQIINVMSTILKTNNPAFTTVLLEQYCNLCLANTDINSETSCLLDILNLLASDNSTKTLVYNVVTKNEDLYISVNQEAFFEILSDIETKRNDINELKEELSSVVNLKFSHKCLTDSSKAVQSDRDNFDLADIETLFESDEPASKRVKLTVNQLEDLMMKMEDAASSLCCVTTFTATQRNRISKVCDMLNNIPEY